MGAHQHEVDISFLIEGAIVIALSTSCALVGLQRADLILRFDTDADFRKKVVRIISRNMAEAIAADRDRSSDEAAFKQLVDDVIAAAGKVGS